jgi:hypothetical protein
MWHLKEYPHSDNLETGTAVKTQSSEYIAAIEDSVIIALNGKTIAEDAIMLCETLDPKLSPSPPTKSRDYSVKDVETQINDMIHLANEGRNHSSNVLNRFRALRQVLWQVCFVLFLSSDYITMALFI